MNDSLSQLNKYKDGSEAFINNKYWDTAKTFKRVFFSKVACGDVASYLSWKRMNTIPASCILYC